MHNLWSITYCIQWFEMWKANRCRHHRQQTQGDDKYIAQTFDAGELKKKQCFFRIIFFSIFMKINNTCVKHNFKSIHVSNLFWSREYNSAKEICKYPSFSKVGGNYPLDFVTMHNSNFHKYAKYLCLIWHNCVMLINKMLKIFSFLLVDFGSFHSRFDNVINDSFNYTT
jgi:hypothetical protein